MGLYCEHLHLRSDDQAAVVAAFHDELPDHSAFVTRAVNGWVTVFDADGLPGPEFAGSWPSVLCRKLGVPGLNLKVLQSDLLFYCLFGSQGELVDHSDFEHVFEKTRQSLTRDQAAGLAGRPESLALVAPEGVTGDDVREVLAREHVFRDDNLWDLLGLLGIVHGSARFAELAGPDPFEGADRDPEWEGLVRVGPRT